MLPRRRFLALLGLAPVVAPAALAAAIRPAAPILVAGADISGDPLRLTVAMRDFASGEMRIIATALASSFEDVARDLQDFERRRAALRLLVADEFGPYPSPLRPETAHRGSAGDQAGAVRTPPMAGVSSLDFPGACGSRGFSGRA